jgi:hypothetical protein
MPMIPLYHDPYFTFRFADNRIIPAFTWRGALRDRAGSRMIATGIGAGV